MLYRVLLEWKSQLNTSAARRTHVAPACWLPREKHCRELWANCTRRQQSLPLLAASHNWRSLLFDILSETHRRRWRASSILSLVIICRQIMHARDNSRAGHSLANQPVTSYVGTAVSASNKDAPLHRQPEASTTTARPAMHDRHFTPMYCIMDILKQAGSQTHNEHTRYACMQCEIQTALPANKRK